jgi:hypothetical protein
MRTGTESKIELRRPNHTSCIAKWSPLALLVLCGCEIDVKLKIGTPDKAEQVEKPWQVYATHKETKRIELWWANYPTRSECLKSAKFDVENTIQSMWYSSPFGCIYTGSEYKYVLYLANKMYAPEAFSCVIKFKRPSESGREYGVLAKGGAIETSQYYCVLPEKPQ